MTDLTEHNLTSVFRAYGVSKKFKTLLLKDETKGGKIVGTIALGSNNLDPSDIKVLVGEHNYYYLVFKDIFGIFFTHYELI